MLGKNVIKPLQTEWAATIVLVPNKDGTFRICFDYCKLNAVTNRDLYPITCMYDCIDLLGETTFFLASDTSSGYWKTEMEDNDTDKEAFTPHHESDQFVRMSFGPYDAPETFLRTTDVILSSLEKQVALLYSGDIMIFSKMSERHIEHV